MAVEIKKRPSLGVTNLGAPARVTVSGGTRHMKATWKIPSALVSDKKNDRATHLKIQWTLGVDGKDPHNVAGLTAQNRTEHTINLNSFKVGDKTYTRDSFYPKTKKKLYWVSCMVTPLNALGYSKSPQTGKRQFEKPREPSIGAFAFNTETGVVSVTISTNEGSDYKERYDTRYKVSVKNTRTGSSWVYLDTSTTDTSKTITYNASDYQQLSYAQYIRIKVQAWARGYAGDSKTVEKTYYVAYPNQATIKDPVVTGRTSADKCTIRLDTNRSDAHPVDRVKLQYLANVSYASAGDIPGDASWTDTEIMDDHLCTALAMPVSDLVPDAGKFTWVRVKSYHAAENVLYRYSNYKRVKGLETPAASASDDYIKILSTAPGPDGRSIAVHLGWNASGHDDSTGTELSWSDEVDTWKSTKAPEQYEFTWSDGPVTSGGVTYHDSAAITIKGLEECEKYYIRARRYLEGETVSYSPYSNTETQVTSEKPEAVVATCERYVSKGDPLAVYWTFSGKSMQTQWQIVSGGGTVIASGEGGVGSTQISAERLEAVAENNSLTFTVQVSTGSGYVVSEAHTVTIIEPPVLSISVGAELKAQPLAFTATASVECSLTVLVTSQGAALQLPAGTYRQVSGDTVYSDVIAPVWTESNNVLTASVTLPGGLDFYDRGIYTLSVVATDPGTGLRSAEQTAAVAVGWDHQAPDPYDYVTLTPIDTTEGGYHRQAVQIDLVPPDDCFKLSADTEVVEGKTYYSTDGESYTPVEPAGSEDPSEEGWYDLYDDLYDIYRMTGDGACLIGESFPLTCTATDEYAPYGEGPQSYRVALRTADGDVEFNDVEYTAAGKHMRFDWAGGSLELPYGLTIGDSYSKSFQMRSHLDGSNDGYWNRNIDRKGKLGSSIIKIAQPDAVAGVRQLARYAGPAFVRLPDGSAYEADVQITDLSVTNDAVTAVQVDTEEIGLTQEFALPVPYELEEE